MQMILDEARESYDPSIVQELRSDKYEDLEQNVARVCEWLGRRSIAMSSIVPLC